MNVLILMGSPRIHGNTAELCKPVISELEALGAGVRYVTLEDKNIAPCKACYACQDVAGEYGCVQKDDMANVIESLQDADMVVFASPIYWFDITAQEKAAIDRLYAFGATGFPFTKTALLLDSHSEGVYDAAIAMYKSTCAYCKWEDQGIVTISGMTERDSMASSPKLEEVRELARKLA